MQCNTPLLTNGQSRTASMPFLLRPKDCSAHTPACVTAQTDLTGESNLIRTIQKANQVQMEPLRIVYLSSTLS
jgi:hypothetical protein